MASTFSNVPPPATSFVRTSRVALDPEEARAQDPGAALSADLAGAGEAYLRAHPPPPPVPPPEEREPSPDNNLWAIVRQRFSSLANQTYHWYVKGQCLMFCNDMISSASSVEDVADIVSYTTPTLVRLLDTPQLTFYQWCSAILIKYVEAAAPLLAPYADLLFYLLLSVKTEPTLDCALHICQDVPLGDKAVANVLLFCLNMQYEAGLSDVYTYKLPNAGAQTFLGPEQRQQLLDLLCENCRRFGTVYYIALALARYSVSPVRFADGGLAAYVPLIMRLLSGAGAPERELTGDELIERTFSQPAAGAQGAAGAEPVGMGGAAGGVPVEAADAAVLIRAPGVHDALVAPGAPDAAGGAAGVAAAAAAGVTGVAGAPGPEAPDFSGPADPASPADAAVGAPSGSPGSQPARGPAPLSSPTQPARPAQPSPPQQFPGHRVPGLADLEAQAGAVSGVVSGAVPGAGPFAAPAARASPPGVVMGSRRSSTRREDTRTMNLADLAVQQGLQGPQGPQGAGLGPAVGSAAVPAAAPGPQPQAPPSRRQSGAPQPPSRRQSAPGPQAPPTDSPAPAYQEPQPGPTFMYDSVFDTADPGAPAAAPIGENTIDLLAMAHNLVDNPGSFTREVQFETFGQQPWATGRQPAPGPFEAGSPIVPGLAAARGEPGAPAAARAAQSQAQARAAQLEAQVEQLQQQLAQAAEAAKVQEDRILEYQQTITTLQELYNPSGDPAGRAPGPEGAETRRLQLELSTLKTAFAQLEARYDGLKAHTARQAEHLKRYEAKQGEFRALFDEAQARYDQVKRVANEKVSAYRHEAEAARAAAGQLQAQLRQAQASLEAAEARAAQATQAAQAAQAAQAQASKAHTPHIEALMGQVAQAKAEIARLGAENQKLKTENQKFTEVTRGLMQKLARVTGKG